MSTNASRLISNNPSALPAGTRLGEFDVQLLALLGRSDPSLGETPPHLYAVTLRARKRRRQSSMLDAWFYPMTIGQRLPTIPLWLDPAIRVMLPLETSYQETCRILGIL